MRSLQGRLNSGMAHSKSARAPIQVEYSCDPISVQGQSKVESRSIQDRLKTNRFQSMHTQRMIDQQRSSLAIFKADAHLVIVELNVGAMGCKRVNNPCNDASNNSSCDATGNRWCNMTSQHATYMLSPMSLGPRALSLEL